MSCDNWSRRLPPLPGELLSSCLARNAHAHGTSAYRFLNLIWKDDPVWNRDFDRDPGALGRAGRRPGIPDWLDDVASRLRVGRDVVEAATLAGYRKRIAGPRLVGGDTPLVLSAGVHHRTRTRHALQFCPECLRHGTPYFRKEWRLGFVVACPRHGHTLVDACHHCDAPVAPHRSFTERLTDCHACGRAIADVSCAGTLESMSAGAAALQEHLLATLRDEGGRVEGPWVDREAFDVVRCLIAVTSSTDVSMRLRNALGQRSKPAPTGAARMRFEQCRLAIRAPWLELITAWTAGWPGPFREGAEAAGLTQRSFVRQTLPRSLRDEVDRLPAGVVRDRTWEPVLDEPVLRRLRRTDLDAYRLVRASRILAHCGHAS